MTTATVNFCPSGELPDLNQEINPNNQECEEINTNIIDNNTLQAENFIDVARCRLCLSIIKEECNQVNISDMFNESLTVSKAITQCIPSIKIGRNDQLPKTICTDCFNKTKEFYTFRNTCIKAEIKQQKYIQSRKEKKRKRPDELEEILKKNKSIKVYNKVEEEIMKVLEGTLTEEFRNADSIIIEVRSDEENTETVQVDAASEILKLPKGITVNSCHSKVGETEDVKVIKDEKGNPGFCMIDKYLFQFRLRKGKAINLKCLNEKCTSVATNNLETNVTTVLVAHNHPPPEKSEQEKQMFLYMMHRKMQNDKSLNFRSVYEEFCAANPEIETLVPLKSVINEICLKDTKFPKIDSFKDFFNLIDKDICQRLQFTHSDIQFYQEKFKADDGSMAVVFANRETIDNNSDSKLMYVDASFRLDTKDTFNYHLMVVLVWVSQSYYPILFAFVSEPSQEIYKMIFKYLREELAPNLRPNEIVTDYQAAIYYSLGEIYLESHIGGAVFYYTQDLYKKICSLNLSQELETNAYFRNIYHMILMLPLLPVNTISDGLSNIEVQANEMGLSELSKPLFDYVKNQWMEQVTPDLFCVHRLENRINENVTATFKKLRDLVMLSKGKMRKQEIGICLIIEKIKELDSFLQEAYTTPAKNSFTRDLKSSQKRNVIRAWQFIEIHPKININTFFMKVLGYIKCMVNQLWIWGFYRFSPEDETELINAANFSIVNEPQYEQSQELEVTNLIPDHENAI